MPNISDLARSRYYPSTNNDTNLVIPTERSRLGNELEEAYGFDILADPANADIDIVFVHGLNGNRETTWSSANPYVLWPRDLLAQDLPSARILTFGYNADIVRTWGPVSPSTLRNHGEGLAMRLYLLRTDSGSDNRPIIFVTHSLGGLVCEQALLSCRNVSARLKVLDATKAIMFLGTPHSGSTKAKWGTILRRFTSLFVDTSSLLDTLEPMSEVLANLQQDFHMMLEQRKEAGRGIDILCCVEELPWSTTVGKIVEDNSAILYGYQYIHLPGNHTSMTKFSSRTDQYNVVMQRLRVWQREAENIETKKSEADSKQGEHESWRSQDRRVFNSYGTNAAIGHVFHGGSNPVFNYGAPPR